MEINRHKHAYELEDLQYLNRRLYSYTENGKKYFYKEVVDENGNGLQNFVYLFDHKRMIFAEVVNSKLAKYFGLNCPEYKIACNEDGYGVLSRDVKEIHPYCETLRQYLVKKYAYNGQHSLQQYKKFSLTAKLKNVYDDLDKAVLFHCAIGQKDGHSDNILVHNEEGKHTKAITGITLIDNSLTYPSQIKVMSKLSHMYDKPNELLTMYTGVDQYLAGKTTLPMFYDSLAHSKHISTKMIEEHLKNATNVLQNGVLKDIQNEIAEEYKANEECGFYKKLRHFIASEQIVLEKTTSDIEKAYTERTR